MMSFLELYAVPDERHIIDAIDPTTGLTQVYGKTEDQVKAENPNAVRMTWEAWQGIQAERQNTPIRWDETTEKQYLDMLEVLPPALWLAGGFLVGEPDDHCVLTGKPRFRAYFHAGNRYLVANRPMTCAEFRQYAGAGVSLI